MPRKSTEARTQESVELFPPTPRPSDGDAADKKPKREKKDRGDETPDERRERRRLKREAKDARRAAKAADGPSPGSVTDIATAQVVPTELAVDSDAEGKLDRKRKSTASAQIAAVKSTSEGAGAALVVAGEGADGDEKKTTKAERKLERQRLKVAEPELPREAITTSPPISADDADAERLRDEKEQRRSLRRDRRAARAAAGASDDGETAVVADLSFVPAELPPSAVASAASDDRSVRTDDAVVLSGTTKERKRQREAQSSIQQHLVAQLPTATRSDGHSDDGVDAERVERKRLRAERRASRKVAAAPESADGTVPPADHDAQHGPTTISINDIECVVTGTTLFPDLLFGPCVLLKDMTSQRLLLPNAFNGSVTIIPGRQYRTVRLVGGHLMSAGILVDDDLVAPRTWVHETVSGVYRASSMAALPTHVADARDAATRVRPLNAAEDTRPLSAGEVAARDDAASDTFRDAYRAVLQERKERLLSEAVTGSGHEYGVRVARLTAYSAFTAQQQGVSFAVCKERWAALSDEGRRAYDVSADAANQEAVQVDAVAAATLEGQRREQHRRAVASAHVVHHDHAAMDDIVNAEYNELHSQQLDSAHGFDGHEHANGVSYGASASPSGSPARPMHHPHHGDDVDGLFSTQPGENAAMSPPRVRSQLQHAGSPGRRASQLVNPSQASRLSQSQALFGVQDDDDDGSDDDDAAHAFIASIF
jgi:hypothetical protein